MIVSKLFTQVIFVCFLMLTPSIISAQKNPAIISKQVTAVDSIEDEFDVNEMIMHHVKDAHEWHLWGSEHEGVSLHLPVILYDNGFKVFSASHFYHGLNVLDKDALFHEKIYRLSEGKMHFKDGHPHNPMPLDLSITKNVTSLFFGAFLLLIIMFSMAKFYKKNGSVAPKGIAKFLEPLVLLVQDDIAKANIGEAKYKKYVPYLLTAFFFILLNNLLGMVPILPGGANLTGNISVTLFLALFTLLITVFSGNKNYWRHIFATPGVPIPILIIMVPIEIIGIFTKPKLSDA